MNRPRGWQAPFAAIALAFLAVAALHLVRLIAPPAGDPSTPARHAVFMAINLAVGAGLLLRPRWFLVVFGLLTIQQLHSHGGALIERWRQTGAPSGEDLAVVVLVPVILGLLVVDARRGREEEGEGA